MPTNKIYIDACCFIESLKGDVGKADPTREADLDMLKRILSAARDENLVVYTSLFTVAEVVKGGSGVVDDALKTKIEKLLLSGRDGVTIVGLTPAISIRARNLAWEHELTGVRGADRVHLASAIQAGAKEFLSWDNRLGKKMANVDLRMIRLIRPSDTQCLPSEYRANDLFGKKK